MEIEKPFKCSVCNSQFTNEDHLQVHKKRHEMSLNFKEGIQQSQTTLDSFVDETPTPTRFFRNCEEVGLFQDLQNVNPFDEQFSKAAGSTPSTGGAPFDFSIAMPSSSISISAASAASSSSTSSSNTNSGNNSSNKRRYSDQDTLNTPQVFGYVMNSTSSTTTNTCSTSSILTPMPPSASMTLDKDNEKKPLESERSDNEDGKTKLENTSASKDDVNYQLSTVPSDNTNASVSTNVFKSTTKSKTMLRLNLSPITPVLQVQVDTADSGSGSPNNKKLKTTQVEPEKKAEKLERNRAAASRSRHRRKQWVSSLESKCKSLELLLAQAKAELANQQTEIQILRNELSRHGNCDVTRRVVVTSEASLPISTQSQQVQILVQQKQQPNILRQISQPVVVTSNTIVVSPNCDTTSIPHSQPVFVTPVVIPRAKAKRGRPRRGQERRIALVNAPTVSEISEVPVKVQIMPVNRTIGNNEVTYILRS